MLERGYIDAAVRARLDAALHPKVTKLLDDAALVPGPYSLGLGLDRSVWQHYNHSKSAQ